VAGNSAKNYQSVSQRKSQFSIHNDGRNGKNPITRIHSIGASFQNTGNFVMSHRTVCEGWATKHQVLKGWGQRKQWQLHSQQLWKNKAQKNL